MSRILLGTAIFRQCQLVKARFVLCEVPNEFLVVISVNTMDAGAIPGRSMRFVLDTWQWDEFFSGYFGFPLSVSFQQCSTLCSYQKHKRAKPGNLPTSNILLEIGDRRIKNYFHSSS